MSAVEHDLLTHFVRKYSGEPLAAPFPSMRVIWLFLVAIRGIASKVSPQAKVALARIFFRFSVKWAVLRTESVQAPVRHACSST